MSIKKLKKTASFFLIVLFTLAVFSPLGFAIEEPINQTIDSTTWTAVSLGTGQTCSAYAIQSRDGTAFMIKKTSTSTPYWTIKADGGLNPAEYHGVPGGILFYAQSASGSVVVEVFIVK